MIVYDLECGAGHRFEGWFAGADEYTRQHEAALIACPLCGDSGVRRVPAAPRINVGAVAASPSAPAPTQATMREMHEFIERNSEDVGTQFAQEARRIHYGESEQRNIRGQASIKEVKALVEEGVSVLPIPPKSEKLN